jgi:hypothetical protein
VQLHLVLALRRRWLRLESELAQQLSHMDDGLASRRGEADAHDVTVLDNLRWEEHTGDVQASATAQRAIATYGVSATS